MNVEDNGGVIAISLKVINWSEQFWTEVDIGQMFYVVLFITSDLAAYAVVNTRNIAIKKRETDATVLWDLWMMTVLSVYSSSGRMSFIKLKDLSVPNYVRFGRRDLLCWLVIRTMLVILQIVRIRFYESGSFERRFKLFLSLPVHGKDLSGCFFMLLGGSSVVYRHWETDNDNDPSDCSIMIFDLRWRYSTDVRWWTSL